MAQAGAFHKLKNFDIIPRLVSLTDNGAHNVSVLFWSDAARSVEYGQLCYICGVAYSLLIQMTLASLIFYHGPHETLDAHSSCLARLRSWPVVRTLMKAKPLPRLSWLYSVKELCSLLLFILKICWMLYRLSARRTISQSSQTWMSFNTRSETVRYKRRSGSLATLARPTLVPNRILLGKMLSCCQ